MEGIIFELAGPRAPELLELWERFERSHPHDRPHYYLSLLGVHPDRRGEGLGMALLAENLERLDAEGCPPIWSRATPPTIAAMRPRLPAGRRIHDAGWRMHRRDDVARRRRRPLRVAALCKPLFTRHKTARQRRSDSAARKGGRWTKRSGGTIATQRHRGFAARRVGDRIRHQLHRFCSGPST